MARGDTTSTAVPAESTKQYVTWRSDNHFMSRELSAANVRSLGATEGKKLRWDKSNDFRVERSEIPLTDAQLADFLARDDRFKLVEG